MPYLHTTNTHTVRIWTVIWVVFLSHGVFEPATACYEPGVEDVVMTTVANDFKSLLLSYCNNIVSYQSVLLSAVILEPSHVVALTHSTIQDGWTALEAASNRGHHKVVEVLLRAGANPNLQNKVSTRQNRILGRCLTFGLHPLRLFCMFLVVCYDNIHLYYVLIMVQPFKCILYPACWALCRAYSMH